MKLRISKRGSLGALMLSVAVLSGCASTGSSLFSPSADDRLTSSDDAKFFSSSGYSACLAGVGLAGAGCLLLGGDNKVACMVTAAVALCGIAMGTNYYLDKRRSEYANTSERLHAMTADVEEDSQKVLARTATAREVIRDNTASLEQLKIQIARNEVDQKTAERELAKVDKDIALLQTDVENMQKKATQYREVTAAEQKEVKTGAERRDLNAMNAEIVKLETQVERLNNEVNKLYTLRSAISLG